jgi:hypothetical protein
VLKRVLLIVAIAALAFVAYALLRGVSGGDTVRTGSGYTYAVPQGWRHWLPCDRNPFTAAVYTDDGCTRPDPAGDAGAYLVSLPVATGRSATDVADELSARVTGYRACTGEGGCLRSVAQPGQRAEVRVRVEHGRAVAMLCLRVDRSDVARGCDVVWNHIDLTPTGSPGGSTSRRGAAPG